MRRSSRQFSRVLVVCLLLCGLAVSIVHHALCVGETFPERSAHQTASDKRSSQDAAHSKESCQICAAYRALGTSLVTAAVALVLLFTLEALASPLTLSPGYFPAPRLFVRSSLDPPLAA